MNFRSIAASHFRLLTLAPLLFLAACTATQPTTLTADARAIAPTLTAPAPSTTSAPATSNFINVRALIIVRHADIDVAKKRIMGDKVPLLDRGNERAKELAYALKDAGITRIVTSEALRTQQTAAVLVEQLHIKPETPFEHGVAFMKGDASKTENSTVVDYLAQNAKPADIVLLVHHHSVIPSILKEMGFPAEPHYDDATEFDRIYVIIPNPATKTYQLLRLRYGGDWHQK